MRIDMHCHALGKGNDITAVDGEVYFNPEDNQHWFTRILYNLLEEDLVRMEADLNQDQTISTEEYFSLLYRLLSTSEELDALVLLALDAVYSARDGRLDERKTDLWVSNGFLLSVIRDLNEKMKQEGALKRFFLGASVSPNRRDWAEELELVFSQPEAVLVKLIPSVQHIRLMSDRHREFYDMLASVGMPLLCHVGPEYSFPEGIRRKELDDFRYLEKPLERGVTVIAAHCATPVFPLIDKNVIGEFYRFMRKAHTSNEVRLWADTSALSVATRLPLIPEIIETFPPDWLVHGSDFPIPADSWPHLPLVTHDVTPEEYLSICKTGNPFDRDVRIKRAHGFPNSIIENALKVLRLPDSPDV